MEGKQQRFSDYRENESSLRLWSESEAEAREFVEELGDELDLNKVLVGKRRTKRNKGYLKGVYRLYGPERGGITDKVYNAPDSVVRAVQWCTPDNMITLGDELIISIENTNHILVYNNIAQRMPRVMLPASLETPSIIFQLVGEDTDEYLKTWFMKTFQKANSIFDAPCLAIFFREDNYKEKLELLKSLLISRVEENFDKFRELSQIIISDMNEFADKFNPESVLYTKRGNPRNWLRVKDGKVIIKIGANPDRQGWKTKGTGNLDPYPGLVKMAEILFAYNNEGERTREVITYFSELPEDFWWFEKYSDELYYTLIKEFSDSVLYRDQFEL